MAFTLANAKQYLKDLDAQSGSAQSDRQYLRICNDANSALHALGDWDFDRRNATLAYATAKTAGTVSIAAGLTAVTGAGTAFAAADVDKFIRFNGENYAYRISAYISATAITLAEAYQGETDLAAVTYELCDERKALPARFRQVCGPVQTSLGRVLEPISMERLNVLRSFNHQVAEPSMYAVEYVETAGVSAAYLWLYPAPREKRLIVLSHYVTGLELTADGDAFSVPDLAPVHMVLRAYLQGFLLEAQGKAGEAVAQISKADELGKRVLTKLRTSNQPMQRAEWTPEADSCERRASDEGLSQISVTYQ